MGGPVVRYHLNNAPTSLYVEASFLRGWSKSLIPFSRNDNVSVANNIVLATGLTFSIRRSFKGLVSAGLIKQWGVQGVGVRPQAGGCIRSGGNNCLRRRLTCARGGDQVHRTVVFSLERRAYRLMMTPGAR